VTAFEEPSRGNIVWASDPLSKKGRPMLVLGTPQFPTTACNSSRLISTKASHDEALTLRDDDYRGDPLGEEVTQLRHRLDA
jgi:hypothetical protein